VSSTADHSVEIRGRHNRRDGGYALAVIHGGQGRSPRQLDAADRRPAGEEAFTVSPSTYLGHYVAGTLAGRHGIALRLSPGEGGRGVTAVIRLLADSTLGAGSPGGMFGPGGSVPFGPRRGRRGRRSGRPGGLPRGCVGPGPGRDPGSAPAERQLAFIPGRGPRPGSATMSSPIRGCSSAG